MDINDFKHMMPHTVVHTPLASRDSYGVITYGTPVSYSYSRVVYKSSQVRSATGEVTMARGTVWFTAVVDLDVNDKLTLPDASTPPLISWDTYPDDSGNLYTKAYFG